MKILVTFAVEAEFAPWRKLRTFRRRSVNFGRSRKESIPVREASVGGHVVSVLLTGMGKPDTTVLDRLATSREFSLLLSSGTAGALSADLRVGDLIAPKRVGTLRDSHGFPISSALLSAAEKRGAKIVEALLSSDRVIDSAEEKANLSFFGSAVDMESAYLMDWSAAQKVPAITIRSISDDSTHDLPVDFEQILTTKGRVRPFKLAKELWKEPAKTRELIRFGKQSKHAASVLATFLDSFVANLNAEMLPEEKSAANSEPRKQKLRMAAR